MHSGDAYPVNIIYSNEPFLPAILQRQVLNRHPRQDFRFSLETTFHSTVARLRKTGVFPHAINFTVSWKISEARFLLQQAAECCTCHDSMLTYESSLSLHQLVSICNLHASTVLAARIEPTNCQAQSSVISPTDEQCHDSISMWCRLTWRGHLCKMC